MPTADTVLARRLAYYRNGFRPVALHNGEKFPRGPDAQQWPDKARRDPPDACLRVHPDRLGTGVLADGLCPIDIDLDDPEKVQAVLGFVIETFGYAPMRFRDNAPRLLLLFQAAEGEPRKRAVANRDTGERVEVLGRGNQFVSDGLHPSGAIVQWRGGSPEAVQRADLLALTDEQVDSLLAFSGAVIGAQYHKREDCPLAPLIGSDKAAGAGWPIADIRSALAKIGHMIDDRQDWFTIACAVYDAAAGSAAGYEAWRAWSEPSAKYSESACAELWSSLHGYDPSARRITAGTLFHAVQAIDPNWIRPSRTFTQLHSRNKHHAHAES